MKICASTNTSLWIQLFSNHSYLNPVLQNLFSIDYVLQLNSCAEGSLMSTWCSTQGIIRMMWTAWICVRHCMINVRYDMISLCVIDANRLLTVGKALFWLSLYHWWYFVYGSSIWFLIFMEHMSVMYVDWDTPHLGLVVCYVDLLAVFPCRHWCKWCSKNREVLIQM